MVRRLLQALILGTIACASSATALSAQAPPVAAPPTVSTPGGTGRAQGPGAGFVPVQIGPPAPVPPEVAMLRPSATELTELNRALKTFVDTNTSPAKDLLKKYESLVMIEPPRLNTAATFTQTNQRRGPRHLGFVEIAKAGNIDLLLHGDSITDWWVQNEENTLVFNKYFGHVRTANFAIAGDTTQGVLWGLRNGEGQGFQPKAVIAAKILLLGIFPRSVPGDPVRDRLAEVNRLIARLDDQRNVFFMDIGPTFLDEKGVFLPNTFRPDNLHPVAGGYEIWGAAVKDKLAELIK